MAGAIWLRIFGMIDAGDGGARDGQPSMIAVDGDVDFHTLRLYCTTALVVQPWRPKMVERGATP